MLMMKVVFVRSSLSAFSEEMSPAERLQKIFGLGINNNQEQEQ